MGWSHCAEDEIADNLQCPACGVSKEAWTLTVNATRTFVVSNKNRPKREKSAWIEVELPGGAGAAVELELPDGQVIAAALDGAGTLRQEQLYPGECRVRFPGRAVAPAPEDPDGWTPCETGRRHAFAASSGVTIAWPPLKHTQWVNLAPDAKDRSRGNIVMVRVAGAAGQRVFARLERGAKNSARCEPPTRIVGATNDLIALTVAASGEALVEVDVGLAGGDVFTLRAGGTEACADALVEVTTWRRLSCQITTRRRATKLPDLGPMIKALREVFIEFVVHKELLIEEGDPSLPPGSWMDASERSSVQTGKRLIGGNHNMGALQGLYQAQETLTGVHLLIIDESFDAVSQERWNGPRDPHRVVLEREIVAHATQTISVSEDRVAPPKRPGEKTLVVFSRKLLDGTPSLVSGSWESKAPPGHPEHGKKGSISADDIKKIRFGQVTLELVREELARTGGHPVHVRLELEAVRDGNLGQAQSFNMIVVQNGDVVDPLFWSSLVMHELGHVLRQAGHNDFAPGLERVHDRTYTGSDHVGHHCGFGLTDLEWAGRSYGGLRGTCLMFGEVTDPPNLQFCEKCRPYILADSCQPIASASGVPVQPSDAG